MNGIAIVKSLNEGKFFVKDSLGNMRELNIGDEIFKNDIIFSDKSNMSRAQITLTLSNEDVVALDSDSKVLNTDSNELTLGNGETLLSEGNIEDILKEQGTSAWNNVSDDSTNIETAAGDATDVDTAAGDEVAEDGGALRSKFQSRDGDMTDVMSDLRDTSWMYGGDNEIEQEVEDMLLETPLPIVYTIIDGDYVVSEGGVATYTVKLIDEDGNPVVATEDTIVYIRYTNKSTQDDDTEYKDGDMISVVIRAGTSEATFSLQTNDDYLADDDEIYNLEIIGNNSTEYDLRTGDVNGARKDLDTTIKDNTTDNPNESSTTEEDQENVILKIFAADKDGNPLKDGITGEYLTVNEVAEGEEAYYVVLAFEPEATTFNDSTVLKDQAGTVEIETLDKGATGVNSQTTNDGSEDYISKKETVELGKPIKVETLDDYKADQDEQYEIQITDKSYEHPTTGPVYENVVTDKESVTTTIKDNAPSKNEEVGTGGADDGSYGAEDTVYVKITGNTSIVEGGTHTHTLTLEDKDGKAVNIPAGETVTVTLEYKIKTGTESDDYVIQEQEVTITGPASSITFDSITKIDFEDEGNEEYTVTIKEVQEQSGAFENVVVHPTQNTVTETIEDGIVIGITDIKVDEDKFYQDKDGHNTPIKNSNINGTGDLFIIPNNYEKDVGTVTVSFAGVPIVTVDGGSYALKSNGVDVEYTVVGNKITGMAGSVKVFEIELGKNGEYTYNQYENIDHPKYGDVTTEAGYEQYNTLDDIDLNFQFNISVDSKNGQGPVTSGPHDFTVTVNDSSPDTKDRTETMNEDGTLTIVLSDEPFKDGKIKINNGHDKQDGDDYITVAKDGTVDIYDGTEVIGTLKNNGNGTLTFEPNKKYSKYEAEDDGTLPNFKYQVTDSDGDYASATVSIHVKPVTNGVKIETSRVDAWEDASTYDDEDTANKETTGGALIPLGLKQPKILDNTDQNDGARGDHGERVDYITLKFTNGNLVNGAKLLYADGTEIVEITSKNQEVKIVIIKDDGTVDTDFHHSNIELGKEGVIYLTKEEYESLQIQHKSNNDTDITITISTKTHEVDDDGKPLSSIAAKTNSSSMAVYIKPATDEIELNWENNIDSEIGQVESNKTNIDGNTSDVFVFNRIEEDSLIDFNELLTNTSGTDANGDLDGSEHRQYVIKLEVGSEQELPSHIFVSGVKVELKDGVYTINFGANENKLVDPTFTLKFPEGYSGGTLKGSITLNVQDKGSDANGNIENQANWGEVKSETVYFEVAVEPVAGDALVTFGVGQPQGFEDAGRAGGNTKDKDGTITNPEKGIIIPIKVAPTTDKDDSETFNVTIKNIPNGGALFVKDSFTEEDVLITFDENGTPTLTVWENGVEVGPYIPETDPITGDPYISAGNGSVTIVDYDNANPPKFIPPHNAHGDYNLKVEAVTVDSVEIDGVLVVDKQEVATEKDINVVVKDVADSVVGNDYNSEELLLEDGEKEEYNAIVGETDAETNGIKLDSIFKDSTKLESYDEASEALSIVISGLPEGVTLEGNVITLSNGQYSFKAEDIKGITIVTPPNYSGELNFDITYITTEIGEAGNPSKTNDSKAETDKVSIFVKPEVDSTINKTTGTYEDSETVIDGNSYYKVNLGIVHSGEDTDEFIDSITLNEPEGDYTLYIKESDGTFKEIEFTSGKYEIAKEDFGNIYVQVKEHEHGDFKISGSYTIIDNSYGNKDVNYEDIKTEDFTHTVVVKPVTDDPTIIVKEGTQTHITVDLHLSDEKGIEIPIKVESADKDGSENITKIVISGVPQGVSVVFGDLEEDGKITVSEHNGIYTIQGKGDYKLNAEDYKDITFIIDPDNDFMRREITIEVFTKDAGDAEEKSDKTSIILEKYPTEPGAQADIALKENYADFLATEDTEFNFLDIFDVVTPEGASDGKVTITFTLDIENATVKGLTPNEDGSYTITGNRADVESVLASLKVVPNKDFNINHGFVSIIVQVGDKEPVVADEIKVDPVTDKATVAITPISSTTIDENGEFSFKVQVTNNSDGEFTNLEEFYIKVKENFEAGETAKGTLTLKDGTVLVYEDGKGYKLPDGYKLGDEIELKYTSGANRHGTVDFEVIVVNKETGAENTLTANNDVHITVKPVASTQVGIAEKKNGVEDGDMPSIKLKVKEGTEDPSEKFESITVKVAAGILIYYGDGTSLAMNAGDGTWVIPINSDGTLPEIFFKGKEHLGGDVEYEITVNVKDGDTKVPLDLDKGTVYIEEVADGVTIDPTKTGIEQNGFEWTDLNLNAMMKDMDGSEKMYLTFENLNETAQFRIVEEDGNIKDLSSQAKFEDGKWTIEGIEVGDINSIQITQDNAVNGVKVEAWTVDGSDKSANVTGEFDLVFKQNALKDGTLSLGEEVNIDFGKLKDLYENGELNTIDLKNDGENKLNLNLDDLLSSKPAGDISFIISGDKEDELLFSGDKSNWTKSDSSDKEGYDVYECSDDPTLKLYIDQEIHTDL